MERCEYHPRKGWYKHAYDCLFFAVGLKVVDGIEFTIYKLRDDLCLSVPTNFLQ